MKKMKSLVLSLMLISGSVPYAGAVQTCQRTDFLCFESGPSQNLSTPYRVDSSGNITTTGTMAITGATTQTGALNTQANIIQGVSGTGTANTTTSANTSLAIPVMVSTAVLQGMVIIATTVNGTNPTLVNGVMAATTGSTAVIGVADAAASSGTVLNVDYSGPAVILTTGAVSVGDLLVSTMSNNTVTYGYAATNNSAAAGSIIGTALQAQLASYNGLTRVLLHH